MSKKTLFAVLFGLITGLSLVSGMAAGADELSNGKERLLMDAGWRFHRGDLPNPNRVSITQWKWKSESRSLANAENAQPANADGPDWQTAQPGQDTFDRKAGLAWYQATLPGLQNAGRSLHFESVDDNATVWLNGKKLFAHKGWNEPFDVPLDSAWNSTGPNVVTVLVENTANSGGIGETTAQSRADTVTSGPAAVSYDDNSWRTLHLPHDFVVEGSFDPKGNVGHGFLIPTVGWYRKTFPLPAADRGKRLWLDFDGVYRDSDAWLNGRHLGNHKSGYTGFRYDITDAVNYGGTNTLAVRADARAFEGWWYEGGGIYRHVWLNKADVVHIAPDSLRVTTQTVGDPAHPDNAQVTVKFDMPPWLSGQGPRRINYQIRAEILDKKNHVVARATQTGTQADEEGASYTLSTMLPHPELWSVNNPDLYRVVVRLHEDSYDRTPTGKAGRILDTGSTTFGVRTVRFDAEKGLFLNGESIKIQGVCCHQDFAGVGIALSDSLLEWRIRKLKEMGANAYRCSHNPPTKELLDACDRLGMLVMDENRHLGDTYRDHTPSGTPASDLSDLRDMIRRDRNHPSIIMWSLCNEEGLQGSEEGAKIFAAMKQAVLELDATRPVTCAMNGGWGYGISKVEDLQGCNYNPRGYDAFHKAHPEIPMYGSETASALSTRGEYVNDTAKGYVNAYDVNAPFWGQTAENAWRPIAERPFVAGGFVWTGFDYRGEPTPYAWPCINSHFGIMDMCGFPKDTYYYYRAWWSGQETVHLLPHWNWPGKEGQSVDVWCHSNADRVELFLNGASMGTRDVPRYGHCEWKVPYAPGKLEAKGYRNGKIIASDSVETTGSATQIRLTADRKSLKADGEDMIPVTVSVLDAKGRVVPLGDNAITFAVAGAGTLAGVGNGDASSHESDKASSRQAFHGLCLAVVQAGEQSGTVTLSASAPGLKSARLTLRVKK